MSNDNVYTISGDRVEAFDEWAHSMVMRYVGEDKDLAFALFKQTIMAAGPLALPAILGILWEYAGYSDEERAILQKAHDDVVASDTIYQGRREAPPGVSS